MAIAENDVGCRRIGAFTSEAIRLFFIAGETGAMMFGSDGSAGNKIIQSKDIHEINIFVARWTHMHNWEQVPHCSHG